jgi:hypothetical protein
MTSSGLPRYQLLVLVAKLVDAGQKITGMKNLNMNGFLNLLGP